MNSEQRARELLAEELKASGYDFLAAAVLDGTATDADDPNEPLNISLRAIARALEQREGWRENGDAALSHISNALEDLESSPDQRPVPQLREAMHYVRAMLAAVAKFGGA